MFVVLVVVSGNQKMMEIRLEAYETLYHVLVTLTKVMAPITPMVSEAVYRGLTES